MIERQRVMLMVKRWFECKKYKKKFIELLLFHELCMFKVEKVSIFSRFIIINNVFKGYGCFIPITLFFKLKTFI